tara:strand:- start:878 stop:1255 length:378 start_codon:yes stop_codon:yes gene_type:complete
MSHITGHYIYDFTRIDPYWNNSSETGISSLVVGMTCSFSGQDSQEVAQTKSAYVDGATGFSPCITYDYLTNNLTDICNTYASGCDWFDTLKNQISGSLESPVRISNFPFPNSGDPSPNPHEIDQD